MGTNGEKMYIKNTKKELKSPTHKIIKITYMQKNYKNEKISPSELPWYPALRAGKVHVVCCDERNSWVMECRKKRSGKLPV